MLETLKQLQEIVNGPESERTREWYFGKFFTGTIGLKLEDKGYTLGFYKGEMVSVEEGLPLSGADFGLAGSMDCWRDFFERGIFGFATAPPYQNPLGLTVTGSVLCFRQNYNICAHICKLFAGLCREGGLS